MAMAAEGVAFQQAYFRIAEVLEHQASPIDLARKLYSKNVIGRAIKNRIGNGGVSRETDVETLLRAVENSIQQKPSNFNVFVRCLSKDPVFSEVVEELESMDVQKISKQVIGSTGKIMKQSENTTFGKRLHLVIYPLYLMVILAFTLNIQLDQLQFPDDPQYPLAHHKERSVQHNLPGSSTPFFGRNKELKQITALFHDNKKDIISIHGPPAFGKSALAIEVGYAVLNFGMNVMYIDASETPHLLQNRISSELTLSFEQETANSLVDWVRALRNPTLLILDELDDVLAHKREEFQDLIEKLCQAAPLHVLKILMTSQIHVTFLGRFQQFVVGELDHKAAVQLLDNLTNVKVNVTDSQRLAELVGYCPLTIKVVATLLNKPGMEGSAWLLSELENNVVSTSCLDETIALHHCWKAVMDIAYDNLSDEGQICGHYVALFPGSFNEFAREYIITKPNCPRKLVDASLVERYTHNNMARYIMHKLIKNYFKENMAQQNLSNFQEDFEEMFLAYYSASAYNMAIHITNTEPTTAEEFHHHFSIESHNWKELIRIALSRYEICDVLVSSVAFIQYKNLLPTNVSWLDLFSIYNTQSFHNSCNVLGENICSEVMIQTLKNMHQIEPLVSCSLLKNRKLTSQIEEYISPSLCYCETQLSLIYHFVYVPHVMLLVKSFVDVLIIFCLQNKNINKYLNSSELCQHLIYYYFAFSAILLYVFIHRMTIFLCRIEQYNALFSAQHLFICSAYFAGHIYTLCKVLLNREFEVSKKAVCYRALSAIIVIIFFSYLYIDDDKDAHWARNCFISVWFIYLLDKSREMLAICFTVDPKKELLFSEHFSYSDFHIDKWYIICGLLCVIVLGKIIFLYLDYYFFVGLSKAVVYIGGYTSYYPFLH